ncbi:MAG: DUF1961 family protein [Candidatus Lokiarchaeia archaeon]
MKYLIIGILLLISANVYADTLLYSENFNSYTRKSLPKNWWYEGSKAISIENGYLRMDANPDNSGENYNVSTVWLNKEFSGDLKIEVDAHILKSNGNQNNINLFFNFSDSSGEPLIKTKMSRVDGLYSKYHSSTLKGYIFTYLANGNPDIARFRFRDCPGFNLIKENNGYENRIGRTYHLKIIKRGNSIQFFVDGKNYLNVIDNVFNPENKKGFFGFRTWKTELWWDNLKIYQLL